MKNFNRRSYSGFTLLEVIIAMAILAIAMSAIISAVSRNVNNVNYLQDKTLAHWVAMNKVAEIQVSKEWPQVGLKKGTAPMANHEWYWEVAVANTEDKDVKRIDVKVFAEQGKKESLALIVAYVPRVK